MKKPKKSSKSLGRHKANSGLHLGMKHASAKKAGKKKYHKGKAY
jgi:hypothetical protein